MRFIIAINRLLTGRKKGSTTLLDWNSKFQFLFKVSHFKICFFCFTINNFFSTYQSCHLFFNHSFNWCSRNFFPFPLHPNSFFKLHSPMHRNQSHETHSLGSQSSFTANLHLISQPAHNPEPFPSPQPRKALMNDDSDTLLHLEHEHEGIVPDQLSISLWSDFWVFGDSETALSSEAPRDFLVLQSKPQQVSIYARQHSFRYRFRRSPPAKSKEEKRKLIKSILWEFYDYWGEVFFLLSPCASPQRTLN